MRSRSSAAALGVITCGLMALGVSPARAAETTNSDIVIVREGVVVSDDLYAAALTVRIIGEVRGDLIAFAAEQVIIEGVVTGSVTAVAPLVVVEGSVGGSVRSVSRDLHVTGSVAGDIVATGVTVALSPTSQVAGDVLAWVYDMEALGSIGGDLTGSQRRLDLAGSVTGDVDVSVGRLRIVDELTVGGDLGYRSGREAEGLELATVEGAVVHKTSLPPNLRVRALGLFARVLAVIFVAISAVTTVWAWPDRSRAAARSVVVKPWKNWLYGAAILFSPVLVAAAAAGVLLVAPPAAGLPLLALVVPLIAVLAGLVLVVSLIAGVPVAVRVGEIFKRLGPIGGVLAGSLILGAIWMLPIVGWLIPALALPLGLGAWLLSRREKEPAQSSAV